MLLRSKRLPSRLLDDSVDSCWPCHRPQKTFVLGLRHCRPIGLGVAIPYDRDLRALIVATKKAAHPIGHALERRRNKLRIARETAETIEAEIIKPTDA
jgi:hypothetical protein